MSSSISPNNKIHEAHKNSIPKSPKPTSFLLTYPCNLDTLIPHKKKRSFPSKYRSIPRTFPSLSKNNPFPLPVLPRYPIIDQPRQRIVWPGDRSRSVVTSGRKWRSSIPRATSRVPSEPVVGRVSARVTARRRRYTLFSRPRSSSPRLRRKVATLLSRERGS